jgi:hypothetical protein
MPRDSYLITVKEQELAALHKELGELKTKYASLEKEHYDMKTTYYLSVKGEKNTKSLLDQIESLEKDNKKQRDEIAELKRLNSQQLIDIKLKFDKEINSNRAFYDNMVNKIESVQAIERLCDKQQNRIYQLEDELKNHEKESENKLIQNKLQNDMKFTDMKKKMMDHIKETQKNVVELNLKHMDVSTKLTLLQNHQLLIELEYQSKQIEDLLRKKETYEKKIFELRKDLDVHKEVESLLAEKNKKYVEIIRTFSENGLNPTKESKEINLNIKENLNNENFNNGTREKLFSGVSALSYPIVSNSNSLPFINEENTQKKLNNEYDFNTYSEKKIKKLEISLRKKETEYNILKLNYDSLHNKLTTYEKKINSVYSLFQIGLQKLYEDEELINTNEIFVNINDIKKDDFSSLNNEQKYAVLMILMKYILPMVNLDEIENANFMKENLQHVKMKYHFKNPINDANLMNKSSSGANFGNINKPQKVAKTAVPGFRKSNNREAINLNNFNNLNNLNHMQFNLFNLDSTTSVESPTNISKKKKAGSNFNGFRTGQDFKKSGMDIFQRNLI